MRPAWLWLACFAAVFPLGGRGQDAPAARIEVSAQVLPRARIQCAEASTPVTVTTADLSRGYLDVRRHCTLRSNVPEQVVLLVHPRTGLTVAVDIDGLGPTLRLQDASLEVAPRPARELDLSFRLWLAAGVPPGAYPLPLHVAAVVRTDQ